MEFDQSKIETKLTEEIMLIFSELGKDKVNEIIKLDTHYYNMVYSHVHKVLSKPIQEESLIPNEFDVLNTFNNKINEEKETDLLSAMYAQIAIGLSGRVKDQEKDIINLRCELRIEKEKSNSLEAYSRSLELAIEKAKNAALIKFLEENIEIYEKKMKENYGKEEMYSFCRKDSYQNVKEFIKNQK